MLLPIVLKSNEKNERLQEEFYSAEGAVDLVLDDMKSYEGNMFLFNYDMIMVI